MYLNAIERKNAIEKFNTIGQIQTSIILEYLQVGLRELFCNSVYSIFIHRKLHAINYQSQSTFFSLIKNIIT